MLQAQRRVKPEEIVCKEKLEEEPEGMVIEGPSGEVVECSSGNILPIFLNNHSPYHTP